MILLTSKLKDSGRSRSKLSFNFRTSKPPQTPKVSMEYGKSHWVVPFTWLM